MRWVELLTPAASIAIQCPRCDSHSPECFRVRESAAIGKYTQWDVRVETHDERLEMARSELHTIALVLFDLGE